VVTPIMDSTCSSVVSMGTSFPTNLVWPIEKIHTWPLGSLFQASNSLVSQIDLFDGVCVY
jgi:hypothetical protein